MIVIYFETHRTTRKAITRQLITARGQDGTPDNTRLCRPWKTTRVNPSRPISSRYRESTHRTRCYRDRLGPPSPRHPGQCRCESRPGRSAGRPLLADHRGPVERGRSAAGSSPPSAGHAAAALMPTLHPSIPALASFERSSLRQSRSPPDRTNTTPARSDGRSNSGQSSGGAFSITSTRSQPRRP